MFEGRTAPCSERLDNMAVPDDLLKGPNALAGYGHSERGPRLWIDGLDADPWLRRSFAVYGETFTLEAGADRHCTGRHDLTTGRSATCPARARLSAPDNEQCAACFAATGFNPAFYNAPVVSEQQSRRNLDPHVVYLASFGPGVRKVGMTHAPRRLGRLLEQGARLGVLIAECPNAESARELEAFVATEIGLPESVRGARKRQLLERPVSMLDARRELAALLKRVAARRPEVNPNAEILELDRHYGAADLFETRLADLSETLPAAISGRCLGLVGDVLIMSENGSRYMLPLTPLIAQRIELHAAERPNRFIGQLGFSF